MGGRGLVVSSGRGRPADRFGLSTSGLGHHEDGGTQTWRNWNWLGDKALCRRHDTVAVRLPMRWGTRRVRGDFGGELTSSLPSAGAACPPGEEGRRTAAEGEAAGHNPPCLSEVAYLLEVAYSRPGGEHRTAAAAEGEAAGRNPAGCIRLGEGAASCCPAALSTLAQTPQRNPLPPRLPPPLSPMPSSLSSTTVSRKAQVSLLLSA